MQHDELCDDASFFSVLMVRCSTVASRDFPPVVAELASCIEEVDSPPIFESLGLKSFCFSGILRYFFDRKTPGSAGSAAAHHIYRLNTHVI